MLYTYNSAIHGFSTWLTPQEADSLMTQPCGISVLPEKQYKLHTTRTTLLLGLESLNVQNTALFSAAEASDIVIRVLDTSVCPERKKISDEGYGPIPSTWKGKMRGWG
ncbi:unnamed protein product [Brassica oleracea var. botrytis]|uniref:Inhibitor I9 domain-containing protein n=2 Tax=Brassica oleracea TaxID=3712 RepID=A0A0D3ARI5_BRAOL|nr:unnamed protein product [Brassica oleracea]